ncbi:MAG: hypothetical protein ACKOF3_03600 [Spartobacteria bacterium]
MKVCDACKTENDDTRVFCLECGQRLPASVQGLPAVSSVTKAGASAPALSSIPAPKKSLPRKPSASFGTFASLFFNLLFWALLAGLVFGIYLVSQPPGVIRPAVEKDAAASAALASFFRKASTTPGGAWMGSEESINRFLLENVKLVPVAGLLGIHTEFKRCFVKLGEGNLDFVMEQSLEGHPLYFSLQLQPYSQDGDLKVRFAGATLGRLPVPAPVVPFILGIWQPCFDSLGEVVDSLNTANSASVTPKSLVVRWPGKGEF